ncbi:MAG: DUF5611 family protein [Thermoplasmata archaeon]
MQAFDIKRGHLKNIEGEKLKQLVQDVFGDAEENEGRIETSFGALRRLTVWTEGSVLFVDTEMQKGIDDSTALETIQLYNSFMERATGFTSKQRRDRLQKRARKGKS